jgi:general secretion pathway protein C
MSTVSWLGGAGLPATQAELTTRAPQWAVWVLAAALGVQAAVIVTHLAGGAGRTPRQTPAALSPTRSPVNLAALVNGHLFGVPPAASVDAANAPQTNMPLVLSGVIAATDPSYGLAIIGTAPTNTKVYAVGALLPGNAKLHAVYFDRVLLERNGAIEALLLPRRFGGGPLLPGAAGASPLDRVQRAINNEPNLVSDVLRPQPVFAEGKLRGYRVYPGRNARAFNSLGLRNGDLVMAINGTALDDPNRGNDIFASLGNSDQARVSIVRNGQTLDLTLNMSQIANQAEQLTSGNGGAEAPGPGAATDAGAVPPPDQVPPGPNGPPRALRDSH